MAKKKMTAVPETEQATESYTRYELSPSSESYLYGSGGTPYNDEIRRVKAILREEAYGRAYAEHMGSVSVETVAPRNKKDIKRNETDIKRNKTDIKRNETDIKRTKATPLQRRTNGAAVTVFVFSLLAIAIYVLGKFVTMPGLKGLLFLSEGKDGITVVTELFKNISANGLTLEFGVGVCVLISAVLLVCSAIGSLIIFRRPGAGKVLKTGVFVMFLSAFLSIVLQLVGMNTVPSGAYLVLVFILIEFIVVAFTANGKQRR